MQRKTYQESNADPNAPSGLALDNMNNFDNLPKELRQFIANSIAPWNSVEAYHLMVTEGVSGAIQAIRGAEKNQHNSAVLLGVLPRVKNFNLNRVREESDIDAKKRQRIAEAGERRFRAYRKRNPAGRV